MAAEPSLEIIVPLGKDFQIPVYLGVILAGKATDQNGKDISDQTEWNSDIDGFLGTGSKIRKFLSVGQHRITAKIKSNGIIKTQNTSFIIIEEKEPPITIKSLMELCWGSSMTFSHEEPQRKLGENIRTKIFESISSYQSVKKEKDTEITYHPSINTKMFFDNVTMAMIKTLRNIGIARNSHTNFLNSLSDDYDDSKNFYKELSSFTSLDKEGFAPKILSFVTGGSLLPGIIDLSNLPTKLNYDEKEIIITAIQNEISNKTTSKEIIDAITKLYESSFHISINDVISFIIFGIIGLSVFNVMAKVLTKYQLSKIKKDIEEKQMKYYYENYREDMIVYLQDFHDDVMLLVKKFYAENYTEEYDVSEIIIDKEEFDILYKEKYEDNWELLQNGYYRFKISGIDEGLRIAMFIRYKILPTWFFSPSPHTRLGEIKPQ